MLLALDRAGTIVDRHLLGDSVAAQLDFVLGGYSGATRLERLFADGSILQQNGVSELASESLWPDAFGAGSTLYPSTERTVLVVHPEGRPNTIEVARRALPEHTARGGFERVRAR